MGVSGRGEMAMESLEKGRSKGGAGVRAEAALKISDGGEGRRTRLDEHGGDNDTNLGEGCLFEPLGSYLFREALSLVRVGDRYCFPYRFFSEFSILYLL